MTIKIQAPYYIFAPQLLLKRYYVVAILFCLISQITDARAPTPEKVTPLSPEQYPRVLVLNSYHINFPWTVEAIKGIRTAFERRYPQVHLSFEFMDTRNFPTDQFEQVLISSIEQKYLGRIDSLIVVDNAALEFALEHRYDLFDKVPIYFCGINDLDVSRLASFSQVSGFLESPDVERTLNLIEDNHPNLEYLLILGDSSQAGASVLKKATAVVNNREKHYPTQLFHLWSINELSKTLRNMPENSAILTLSFFHDKFGETYSPSDMVKLIKANTHAPIYSLWKNHIDSGVLGGWAVSGFHQGFAAANLAIDELIHGMASIPLVQGGPTSPFFNHDELIKHKITENKLPPGSQIINKPVTFYNKNQLLIWISLIFMALQSTAIFFLMINSRRRKKVEQRLDVFYQTLKHIPIGVLVVNKNFKIKFINSEYCQDANLRQDEIIGKNLFSLNQLPFNESEARAAFHHLRQDAVWQLEASFSNIQQKMFASSVSSEVLGNKPLEKSYRFMMSAVKNASTDNGHYIILRENIDQHKRSEALLVHRANYDQLTQLPNRNLLLNHLEQRLQEAPRKHLKFALLFIDLDGFKEANDNYGHELGDQVLKMAATRLKDFAQSNNFVARFGGDEFIILLEGKESTQMAQRVSESVIDRLSQPFITKDTTIYLSASIGIATYPNDGDSATSLLKNADLAMYAAKANHKGAFQYFHIDLNRKSMRKLKIQTLLRNAIKNNELSLYYQPIVNASRSLYGCEALLRWHSKELGTIAPAEFIPIAEDIGEIVKIGDWVLRNTLSQLSQWQCQGYTEIQMAVNVSYRQLQHKDFIHKLKDSLDSFVLDSTRVTLEITEQLFIQNTHNTLETLNHIKRLGLHLALDDFGTGYSSLSYLAHYPFDLVKIDRSFSKIMGRQSKIYKLLNGISSLSKELALNVILEGVENEKQWDRIKLLSIDQFQGYWFDKPMPAKPFYDHWLAPINSSGISSGFPNMVQGTSGMLVNDDF